MLLSYTLNNTIKHCIATSMQLNVLPAQHCVFYSYCFTTASETQTKHPNTPNTAHHYTRTRHFPSPRAHCTSPLLPTCTSPLLPTLLVTSVVPTGGLSVCVQHRQVGNAPLSTQHVGMWGNTWVCEVTCVVSQSQGEWFCLVKLGFRHDSLSLTVKHV